MPYDIFIQIARLVTLSIVEFVPLRIRENQVEVLLLERSEENDLWAGQVHAPGTVLRPSDTDIKLAFKRIIEDELGGVEVSEASFVINLLHPSKRGMENAQIYWAEVIGEPKVGKFYPAHNLPNNLIESQRDFIDLAVKNFQNSKA